MLFVRTAVPADFEWVMEIYHSAQEFMIASGNPNQWRRAHPAPDLIREDIAIGLCKVVCDENGIHGAFAPILGEDPTYLQIFGGAWLNDEPYVTIHRIAGDGVVHGIFRCALDYCKTLSANVRIDTHADNRVMQRLVSENGFQKCGTIYLKNGEPRIAFHLAM